MECVSDIVNRFLFPGAEKELFGYLYDPSLSFEEKVRFCGDTPILWPLFEKKKSSNSLLEYASKYNHLPLVLRAIDLGAGDWERGMYSASEGGHLHLVEYFVEKGADAENYCWGMFYAARGGHLHLVEYFIEKGANGWHCGHWNLGMFGAALDGYFHLVEYFVEKGADDWNWGMYYAARGGHLHIVKYFVEKGADDWNEGMEYAAEGGHLHLVEYFREKLNQN